MLCLVAGITTNGFSHGILSPRGEIAKHELKLLVLSSILMMMVVVPVILMTIWFSWRYRSSAKRINFKPEWCYNTVLEIIWWCIPCAIVAVLSIITWNSTHKLDPYKPASSTEQPLVIEIVALNWQWLFIYKHSNVASINDLIIPAKRPIKFRITSISSMNSFFIPELGSQIYAMTGMITNLNILADEIGNYRGFAANYNGTGFAEMQFYTKVVNKCDFDRWVEKIKDINNKLTWNKFWNMNTKFSTKKFVYYFGNVEEHLFNDIIMSYMTPSFSVKKDYLYEYKIKAHKERKN
jgi:cytochrome o ubiquinol oxidase subunit 2